MAMLRRGTVTLVSHVKGLPILLRLSSQFVLCSLLQWKLHGLCCYFFLLVLFS